MLDLAQARARALLVPARCRVSRVYDDLSYYYRQKALWSLNATRASLGEQDCLGAWGVVAVVTVTVAAAS